MGLWSGKYIDWIEWIASWFCVLFQEDWGSNYGLASCSGQFSVRLLFLLLKIGHFSPGMDRNGECSLQHFLINRRYVTQFKPDLEFKSYINFVADKNII